MSRLHSDGCAPGLIVVCPIQRNATQSETYSLHIRVRPLPFSAMKRSIRAVTTGSGTEPSSSTASWNADIEFCPERFFRFFAGAHDRELAPNHREMHAS